MTQRQQVFCLLQFLLRTAERDQHPLASHALPAGHQDTQKPPYRQTRRRPAGMGRQVQPPLRHRPQQNRLHSRSPRRNTSTVRTPSRSCRLHCPKSTACLRGISWISQVTRSRLQEKEKEVQEAVEYFGGKSSLSKSNLMELARSGLKQSGLIKSTFTNKISVLDSRSSLDRGSILESKISLL